MVKLCKLLASLGTYDSGADQLVPVTGEFIVLSLEDRKPIYSNVELEID